MYYQIILVEMLVQFRNALRDVIYLLFTCTVGIWLRYRFNITFRNKELVQTLRPPYLVLANHSSHWDPFILQLAIPHSISYIVAHSHFRSPILAILLKIQGCVAKSKNRPDLASIQGILAEAKLRHCIGIFPEGQSCWDGKTMPIVASTAKLAKLLQIPIIFVHMEGAFFSDGRWTHHARRGEVRIHFKKLMQPESFAKVEPKKLAGMFQQELNYSDAERQKHEMIPYSGRSRAEYLERSLFACPCCLSFDSMHSLRVHFLCRNCGYTVYFTEQGFFQIQKSTATTTGKTGRDTVPAKKKGIVFDSMPAWNQWQLKYLKSYITRYQNASQNSSSIRQNSLFQETGVRIRQGRQIGQIFLLGRGAVELHASTLQLSLPKQQLELDLQSINSINVQKDEHLEFTYGTRLFRLSFASPRTSAYKWMHAIIFLQRNLQDA